MAKENEVQQLDATIQNLINEYTTGNKTWQHVGVLCMNMNQRCLVNDEVQRLRDELAAGKHKKLAF